MSIKLEDYNFVVVGCGRVGTSLLNFFKSKNYKFFGIHTQEIQNFFKNRDFKDIILFITVRDNSIFEISTEISKLNFKVNRGFAFHTSGVYTHEILKPLKEKKFSIASFHPLFPFREKSLPAKIWENMPIAIEGEKNSIEIGFSISLSMKGNPFKIEEGEKPLYHAISSMLSQSGAVIMDMVYNLSKDTDFGNKDFIREGFLKLLCESGKNVAKNGIKCATGPATRKDFKTIKKHLKSLEEKDKRAFTIYREITEYLLKKF